MANWCSNTVAFEGEQSQITDLKILFDALAAKEQKQRKGQLPDFVFEQQGFFFDIQWENDVLYYETKWSPNTEVIMEIAVRFGVDFVHNYEECGNMVFGEAEFKNGVFTDTCLDDQDFELYQRDDDTGLCLFEGEEHDGDAEILEILLERKKAVKNL